MPYHSFTPSPSPPFTPSSSMAARSPLDLLAWFGELAAFAYRGVPAALAALPRFSWWVRPFNGMVVGALPLAFVTGAALGLVVWLHTRDVLAQTFAQAVAYLPTFLGAAVTLELSPLAAGLILASRTGASLGAELASMKVGE